ncbi:MAG: hypothetical protein M0P61_07985 [Ignavibacteriaceae bacterium]|jgi:hypothetical protein|nr:hypothetical protein [Ignavibacteriaceae bacterium]
MNKKLFNIYDEHFSEKENILEKFVDSTELQKELDELNKVSKEITSLSSISVDENYFTTLLPRFRENQAKKRYEFSFKKLVLSTSIAFSTIIVLFFSFQFVQSGHKSNATQQEEITVNNISTVAQDSYITSTDQLSDSIVNDKKVQQEIDKTIYQSLSASSNSNDFSLIKNDNEYDKVLSQLDDEELEKVYSQLQQTKIL